MKQPESVCIACQREASRYYFAARDDQHALTRYTFASEAVRDLCIERACDSQERAALWARQDRVLRGLEA